MERGVLDFQALYPMESSKLHRPCSHRFPSWSSSLHSERIFRMLALETLWGARRPFLLSNTQLPVNPPAVQGLAAPPV